MSSLPDIGRIAQGVSNLAEALPTRAACGRQNVQHSLDGMFKCIPFNDNAAFWQSLGLYLNLHECFFKHWCVCFFIQKHIIQLINATASHERNLDFQFLNYVSSSICCMKKTSASFPYDLQEMTSYIYLIHPQKYMQIEWEHQVDYFVYETAIIFPCIDLPISVHNGRPFSANGFVIAEPIAMKFIRN